MPDRDGNQPVKKKKKGKRKKKKKERRKEKKEKKKEARRKEKRLHTVLDSGCQQARTGRTWRSESCRPDKRQKVKRGMYKKRDPGSGKEKKKTQNAWFTRCDIILCLWKHKGIRRIKEEGGNKPKIERRGKVLGGCFCTIQGLFCFIDYPLTFYI